MPHETDPLSPTSPEPSKETISEMSFNAAIHRAINDLFTCQVIAEKLQNIPPNDALEALVETWKQGLVYHLKETAQGMVQHVVANLDLIQSGESQSLSEIERLEWQQIEHWYTPFPIVTICREDLRGILPDKEIAHLSDEDMTQIAAKMGDTFHNADAYRQNLEITVKSVLNETQSETQQPLEPKHPRQQMDDSAQ